MRKLGRTSSDALELLLDTVCSMFGAILLIAILVALMAQTATVESSSDHVSAEMLRRRIATAEADLAETHRVTAELKTPLDSPAADLAAEKRDLEHALAVAHAQRDRMSTQLQEQVARQTVDFSAEWKKLTFELHALERQQEELANAIKAQDENTARVNGRVAEISKLIQEEKDARVVTLRFPKERARTKRSLPVICKYGKIYPVMDADGARNEATIVWTSQARGSHLSRPVEALGWTPASNTSAIRNLIGSIPKSEVYIAFYVFPDSFDAFRSMRDQAAAAHVEFGMELDNAGDDLIWGSEGSSPPPL